MPPSDPDPNIDLRWMARAIELARQADFRTSPNPMVGAVVLDSAGELAGEGYHRQAGTPHAEQEALEAAGERARGGTLYVNLEPCSHAHRDPSCAQAVVSAGVRRVVVSMVDPDPRVRGDGIKMLEAAGVETAVGALSDQARRLNEFYVKHRLTGRPFVTAKFAMSLDGRIATSAGESRWISGAASRAHAHLLRHAHDAILVGIGTVLADDPQLTARVDGLEARQPLRVVLDSQLRTPPNAKVVGHNTLIVATRAGQVGQAETLVLPRTDDGRVGLGPLLEELGRRGVLSLLVEGGAEVHASFFAEGLVDKVQAYIAPMLIGGRDAPAPIGGEGAKRLRDAIRLTGLETARIGDDLSITGYVDVHRDR
ncbi:MAG TPA: bifunctional diaminohydroxyphosphoribosylaminopyrimidine deaminase/5-amino-6-(5-phosphoribosylamino)uracil reductase RibD [Candidatus Dormibacteraeota bacterium]